MTGYGRARATRNLRDITVEVRSVNNRYLDCTVKMPRMYAFAEDAVKARVQKAVSRGKVDVFISVDASAADVAKEGMTAQVEERSPETVREYREKLTAKMREVLQSTTIDEQRILQEAAIYADKIAVDEETVRLRSHVSQLRGMLASDQPMGRKMDFLIQELNRESNTIGSKCCDVAIAQVVVGLKAEVEKMREQVQNVE